MLVINIKQDICCKANTVGKNLVVTFGLREVPAAKANLLKVQCSMFGKGEGG